MVFNLLLSILMHLFLSLFSFVILLFSITLVELSNSFNRYVYMDGFGKRLWPFRDGYHKWHGIRPLHHLILRTKIKTFSLYNYFNYYNGGSLLVAKYKCDLVLLNKLFIIVPDWITLFAGTYQWNSDLSQAPIIGLINFLGNTEEFLDSKMNIDYLPHPHHWLARILFYTLFFNP